jgi:dienelactone hydrolase
MELPMFEYFPGNYVWNVGINIVLGNGGWIGDVDQACRPALEAAKEGPDAGTKILIDSWIKVADRVAAAGDADAAKNRRFSAAAKYRRATAYYASAERMCAPHSTGRDELYATMLATFGKFMKVSGACQRVEFPYENGALSALLVLAPGSSAASPSPCVVHFDGFDVQKETIFLTGLPEALARRGISTLIVDHPGVGEALRLHGMTVEPRTERPAGAAIDYLETLPEIDRNRIGMMAISMGGYYAPRATAFEPRIKACVCWGGNYDWGAVQRMRFENSKAGKPIPHFWDHLMWATGTSTVEEGLKVADQFTLAGILDRIKCPILITHGEGDRQIPLKYARMTFDHCINSPKRELKIHTREEGAAEHCSLDNTPLAADYIADWLSETLGGTTG